MQETFKKMKKKLYKHLMHCIHMILKGDKPFEKKKTYYFKKQIELTRKKLNKLK
jgi:hypothetical protein